MPDFSRLRLQNWKNFTDGEVELTGRVFLVGPNASGKSNFLDALRFFHDLVSSGGGLQEAVRRRGGVGAIRCLAARRNPNVKLMATVREDEKTEWMYEIEFHQDKQQRPQVKSEKVQRIQKDGAADRATVLLDRPNLDDKVDPLRLSQTHLEQVNVNREFRFLADFFMQIRYLHIVPQLVREPDRSVGRRDDPYGGDFLERLAKVPERTRRSRLNRIRDSLRIAVPQMSEIELWRDERGTPHLRGKYTHWRPQGAWQTEEQFSDGTLRLIGLLWAIMDGTGPLLLEEPELSLHPEIVRHLPQLFARVQRRTSRQIFISSHSLDLLADEGIGLDEIIYLLPGQEGTTLLRADFDQDTRTSVDSGIPLPEAILPKTRPMQASGLTLFGDS